MPDPALAAATAKRDFTIIRRFTAPVEDVFDAWTRPSRIAAWFGPIGLVTPVERLEMDVRPGGSWALTMVAEENGQEYPVEFEYVEVLKPTRLVMRTGAAESAALVTVALRPTDGGTEMTFSVERLVAAPDDAALREGWASSFERLAAHLGETA